MAGEAGDLLDRAPCGFVSFRDDGMIELVNATLLDRLGYSRDEIAGISFEKFLTTGSRIFHQTHFFPLVKLHSRAQEVFLILRSKSGEEVGVLCNAKRREAGHGAITDCVKM